MRDSVFVEAARRLIGERARAFAEANGFAAVVTHPASDGCEYVQVGRNADLEFFQTVDPYGHVVTLAYDAWGEDRYAYREVRTLQELLRGYIGHH